MQGSDQEDHVEATYISIMGNNQEHHEGEHFHSEENIDNLHGRILVVLKFSWLVVYGVRDENDRKEVGVSRKKIE